MTHTAMSRQSFRVLDDDLNRGMVPVLLAPAMNVPSPRSPGAWQQRRVAPVTLLKLRGSPLKHNKMDVIPGFTLVILSRAQ